MMSEKLSTNIYESIRNDIIFGKLGPRTFLSESEVGKRFGVSRAPVRDALHLLCEQGYLISYPRRGYMINTYTNEEINKIQTIRLHLEKLCIKLAIENATDEELESLREFTKKQSKESDPNKSNNTQFHLRLAEITKNEFIPMILRDIINKATLARIGYESDLKGHDYIVDALLERNENKAVEKLENDIKFI